MRRGSSRDRDSSELVDGFPRFPVRFRPRIGGPVIPEIEKTEAGAYDFERLERAVAQLVERHRRVVRENASLRDELDQKRQRIRVLDGQILEANQRRRDVTKRIDDLIAQLDHLESQLGEPES